MKETLTNNPNKMTEPLISIPLKDYNKLLECKKQYEEKLPHIVDFIGYHSRCLPTVFYTGAYAKVYGGTEESRKEVISFLEERFAPVFEDFKLRIELRDKEIKKLEKRTWLEVLLHSWK